MTHNQYPELCAKAQENEPVFLFGVFRIMNQQGVFVEKGRFGFFEGYAMFLLIRAALSFVLFEQ